MSQLTTATNKAGQMSHTSGEDKEEDASRMNPLEAQGFHLGKTLGQGTYAIVKEAYYEKLKKKVAVKIISKNRAPKDYLQKFLPREVEVVKIIRHPNIVMFIMGIETVNRMYLAMEYVPNGDLLGVIKKVKTVQEPRGGFWFSQMVDGIAYCHMKGVVHRDIKCENLLLDKDYNIKITDFGFARSGMLPDKDQKMPLSETYCGSYAYACPEILTGTPYIAQKSDIWSLGVVLYVMVR